MQLPVRISSGLRFDGRFVPKGRKAAPPTEVAPEGRRRSGEIMDLLARSRLRRPCRGGFDSGGDLPRVALAGVPASLHPWLHSAAPPGPSSTQFASNRGFFGATGFAGG